MKQKGFTLIEIMVVVVIIGLLAAIVAPNIIGRIDQAAVARARQDIRAIESALNLYRLDNFKYPSTDEGLQALVTQPGDASATGVHRRGDRPSARPGRSVSAGGVGPISTGRDG